MRYIERRVHRINTSDEVVMLRGITERAQLLASDREENASRGATQCAYGALRVRDINPEVPVHRLPRRSAQPQDRSAGLPGRQHSVGTDRVGIRVCSVYEKVDAVSLQIGRKSCNAPESTDSHRYSLRSRGGSATRQRNRCGKCTPGKCRGELAGLRCSSQDQDIRLHACRH